MGGGGYIDIFVYTDHWNNQFQKKLIVQNTNIWICPPPPPIDFATALNITILSQSPNLPCIWNYHYPCTDLHFKCTKEFSKIDLGNLKSTDVRTVKGNNYLESQNRILLSKWPLMIVVLYERTPCQNCSNLCRNFYWKCINFYRDMRNNDISVLFPSSTLNMKSTGIMVWDYNILHTKKQYVNDNPNNCKHRWRKLYKINRSDKYCKIWLIVAFYAHDSYVTFVWLLRTPI